MLCFSKEDERLVDVALVDGLWYFAHLVFFNAIHTGSNSIIKITEPHTAQARVQQGEGAPQKLAFEREQSSLQQGD
jgi:hypothetical protein